MVYYFHINSTIRMAYAIIVNLLLVFKVIWDYQAKNKEHRIIDHARSAIIDGAIYVFAAWILLGADYIIGATLIAVGYRWIMFDLAFNLANKDKWNHYGTSSVLDRFLTKMGKYHLLIKAIPVVVGVILCLI